MVGAGARLSRRRISLHRSAAPGAAARRMLPAVVSRRRNAAPAARAPAARKRRSDQGSALEGAQGAAARGAGRVFKSRATLAARRCFLKNQIDCHPERSGGGKAGAAQSKDPVECSTTVQDPSTAFRPHLLARLPTPTCPRRLRRDGTPLRLTRFSI